MAWAICILIHTKSVQLKHLDPNQSFVLLGDTITQFEGTNDII